MNKSTQRKIAEAIEKLGKSASYRKIAAEAGVSADTVRRYKQENRTPEEIVHQNRTPESAPESGNAGETPVWDGQRRPLLAMIGYLSSPTTPLGLGKPLPRVPNYKRPECLVNA